MTRVIVYYARPGHKYSHANRATADTARTVTDISFVDPYSEYPRLESVALRQVVVDIDDPSAVKEMHLRK